MTFVEAELLKPEERISREENHERLIDYLIKYYKDGFEMPCNISVNQKEIELDNYDMNLKDSDVIVLIHHQGVTAAVLGLSGITGWLTAVAINIAITYVLGAIFKPSVPNSQSTLSSRNSSGQSSSVYSLNSQQNEAKKGEAIPIIYGKIRTYPALIAPPYYRFEENVEYLYQLMCIGQGSLGINQMLISDTDVITIQGDYFRYETLEYDDFKTVQGIKDKVLAPNYYGLVKTIPDVDNLELRGSPENKSMVMRFENSTITFYPYADGSEVDLSSLTFDSKITISNTVSNNGEYLVDFVTGQVVTIQSHTFTIEPSGTTTMTTSGDWSDYIYGPIQSAFYTDGDRIFRVLLHSGSRPFDYGISTKDNIFKLTSPVTSGDLQVFSNTDAVPTGYETGGTRVFPNPPALPAGTLSLSFEYVAKVYTASFETSYGSFKYEKPHIGFEVDIVYPNGIYDSDSTTGDFLFRDTTFELGINNTNITETKSITTTGKLDNGAIQITYKYIYADNAHATIQDDMALTFKRITTEPTSIQSNDTTYIKSVKFIQEEQNYEPLGDVTLLWCKVRATNAISSIGQFAINAWVTRSDVSNDVKTVLTDLYTNTTYGGRLPLSELEFEDTPTALVNGAIDSRMSLYDAMQMVAKSNNYSLYPVGGALKLKHDTVKPIRTALYNETNIIKDSLKISYLFSEEENTDSVKVSYRDADDFSDQTTIYPIDGFYPEEIELWGCTDSTIADNMAMYLYKQDRSRRKTVEFKTDIQGLIPQFLARIGISHNLPSWGFGGQIKSFVGRVITLDCDHDLIAFPCDETYECEEPFFEVCPTDSNYDTILFRDKNGEVSDLFTFTVIDAVTIELTTDAPTWLYSGEDYDKTFFSIGYNTSIVKDYIITNIKPNGNEITVQCVNYDESIYS